MTDRIAAVFARKIPKLPKPLGEFDRLRGQRTVRLAASMSNAEAGAAIATQLALMLAFAPRTDVS